MYVRYEGNKKNVSGGSVTKTGKKGPQVFQKGCELLNFVYCLYF